MKKDFLLLICLCTVVCGEQAYISAGLTAQYGDGILPGIEIGDTLRETYVYREHFLDITAGYGNFLLWSNLEFSSPPQIGPDYLGLRKLRLSWESGRISVSAGDLYGLLGRGLALNLWENQGIDWDSSLRGIWLTARPTNHLSLDFISGAARGGRHLPQGPGVDPRARDFSDEAMVSAISFAADGVLGGLDLGGYVVDVDASNPWFSKTWNFLTREYDVVDSTEIRTRSTMPGIFAEFSGHVYDVYVEVAGRDHQLEDADSLYSTPLNRWLYYDKQSRGWGAYASFSLYPGPWGLTVEYKNYMFDDSDPDVRSNQLLRLHRRTPVQNPPSVFKEHASTLLSRVPHVMDFEDEVGAQLEAHLEMSEDLFLLLNYAQSNRHTAFRKIIHPDFSSDWERREVSSTFGLADNERFRPFREIYGELNYHYEPLKLDFEGMISVANEVLSFAESLTEKAGSSEWLAVHSKETMNWERRNLLTIPTQITAGIPVGWGFTLNWEHQWEDLEFRNSIVFRDTLSGLIDSVTTNASTTVEFYNRYLALSLGKPSRFSFGVVYDYASHVKSGQPQNSDPGNDSWLEALIRKAGLDLTNKWFGVQFIGYLTPSTILTVFYGSLQGGLKCDSGVCVYVPGIEDALTITLTSNF